MPSAGKPDGQGVEIGGGSSNDAMRGRNRGGLQTTKNKRPGGYRALIAFVAGQNGHPD